MRCRQLARVSFVAIATGLLALHAAIAGPWLDADGRPSDAARQALAVLADAAADGLASTDYGVAALDTAAAALAGAATPTPARRAAFEAALEAAALRYLGDLHRGRVDPRQAGFAVTRPAAPDLAALLHGSEHADRLAAAAAALRPALPAYAALREALARQRTLAAAADGQPLPIWPGSLRAGDRHAALPALRRRLVALGDLAPPAPAASEGDVYDADLEQAVQRFQRRHGLTEDGTAGRSTLAALRVPLAQRVRQIEWALERLRWLRVPPAERAIAINIPMFRLWALERGAPAPALAMDVIVGRALRTHTPVFAAPLTELVFHPYWNVPRSILLDELLAPAEGDPSRLQRQGMEIVRGGGDDAVPVAANAQNLALLRSGLLRLRQRPGPRNALGQLKFVLQNPFDVYLHDTPTTALFSRARRDFSHGCIRVEAPAALAAWLLAGQPEWTAERIAAAMAGPRPLKQPLAQPVPVIVYYLTAFVLPDGELHFADDLYGHDARLQRLLAARRPL